MHALKSLPSPYKYTKHVKINNLTKMKVETKIEIKITK